MAYTYAQLKGIWLNNATGQYKTDAWASTMAAIAEAESGGDPLATNPNDTNGKGGTQTSWGLFQISDGTHAAPSPSWSDPATQVQLAIGKLNSQGLGAWGTYTSGAYKGYLSGKTTADLTAAGGPSHVDTAAATAAAAGAADCLWPPSGGLNIPVIPGLFTQTVSFPCLLTRSEARAVMAVLIIGNGLFVSYLGLALLMKAAGVFAAMQKAGGSVAEAGGLIASLAGQPEIGAPLAAAGAGVKKHGAAGEAKAAAGRQIRKRERQEKRDNRTASEVEARKRDSARGPALRDEPAPF